jgi:prephenate dehydrogenase
MTRLAASSWSSWKEIFATNSAPISDALESLLTKLNLVRDDFRGGQTFAALRTIFEQSQTEESKPTLP